MKVNTSQNMKKYDLDKKCIGYSLKRGRKRNINKENIQQIILDKKLQIAVYLR